MLLSFSALHAHTLSLKIFTVLETLPVGTKNIVTSAKLPDALQRLLQHVSNADNESSSGENGQTEGAEQSEQSPTQAPERLSREESEAVAARANTLLSAWQLLKEVFVIPKAASSDHLVRTNSDRIEIPVERRADLTASSIYAISGDTNTRLTFLADAPAKPGHIVLEITGSNVDAAKERVLATLGEEWSAKRFDALIALDRSPRPLDHAAAQEHREASRGGAAPGLSVK